MKISRLTASVCVCVCVCKEKEEKYLSRVGNSTVNMRRDELLRDFRGLYYNM